MAVIKEHLSKIIIVALLVAVVGVPFLLRPASVASDANVSEKLIIITPHNEQIRYEIETAFNAWRVEQQMQPIAFDWRAMGGTADLRKIVLSRFEAAANEWAEEQGIGIDLFFGGGDFEHNKLAQGVAIERNGERVRIPASVPASLPEGLLEQAFEQPTIGGERLYHPERYWVGVVVSSFGIVYNRDLVRMLELPAEPTTWADLASPRYRGWVALADPGHSGSIAATYNAILRRQGWHEGWRTLRRTFANSRYFTSSSSKVPVDVSAGEAAAGMCIDFYGRFQAGAIGGNRVGYVDPPFMTATTADPISVLRGAPHRELAEQFVAWLLSKEAQALWQRKKGEVGGPRKFELRRQPARRDLYDDADEVAKWTDPQVNPFAMSRPLPEAMPDYYPMVAPVAHAMAIDIHDDLVAAWQAIQRMPMDDPRRAQMEALFDEMPEELTIRWPDDELARLWLAAVETPGHPRGADAAKVLEGFAAGLAGSYYSKNAADRLASDRLKWTQFFRKRYREIVAMGE